MWFDPNMGAMFDPETKEHLHYTPWGYLPEGHLREHCHRTGLALVRMANGGMAWGTRVKDFFRKRLRLERAAGPDPCRPVVVLVEPVSRYLCRRLEGLPRDVWAFEDGEP